MKGKKIELKIYEFLGVKKFRKMVFKLRDTFFLPILKIARLSKEERHKILYESPSNYIMKKGHGIKDLKDFKKQLLFNAGVHIWSLSEFMPSFLKIIDGTASLPTIIITLSCVTINIYCIMLQRYNHIRINQVIKKIEPREKAKICKLKEELIREDSLLNKHTYKVVNKDDKEKDITFEELLETASYEQLKKFREYLSDFKEKNQILEQQRNYTLEEQSVISVPLKKNKTLKLEFK